MDLTKLLEQFKATLAEAHKLNEVKAPTRSRELSLAITNIETGLLWLREAIDNEVPF